MPTIFEQQMREVARSLGLRKEDFHRLDQIREHKVLQDVKRHFLTDPEATCWWQSIRYESTCAALDQAHTRLEELCPNEGKKVWFIPCGEEMVYDAFPGDIVRVLGACPVFEYAVVDKKLRWMTLQNHRDVLYAIGAKTIANLNRMMNNESYTSA